MKQIFYFKKEKNYGDVMTPWLLNKLGIPFYETSLPNANTIVIGSIANKAKPGMHVYGSGFIRRNDIVCSNAIYHWVRGPISREMVLANGGSVPELYGDAALVLPELVTESKKVHDIGYIPHHIHYKGLNKEFKIDLTKGSIDDITKEITKCRFVISSSLHGIIAAHAYGIPAAYIDLGGLSGDGMKFHDHYQSVGLKEAVLSTIDNPVFQVPTEIRTDHIIRLLKE